MRSVNLVEEDTNPADGIGSHAPGLSARHARDVKWPSTARPPGREGFGDNDIAASIKIHINHFTTRPHFPFVPAPVSKASHALSLSLCVSGDIQS